MGGLEVVCRYANDKSADLQRLRRSALRLGLATGFITTLFAAAICPFVLMPGGKLSLLPLAILCGFSFVGQQVMLMMTGVDRGAGRFLAYNVKRLIAASMFPGLILVSLPFHTLSVASACWLFVAASIISMLVCLIGVQRPWTGGGVASTKTLLREGVPYGWSMLATDLFERLDLWLVLWWTPFVTQGYYQTMVPVVYPLTVIPNTLGMFLFNRGANTNEKLTIATVKNIIGLSIGVQIVVTAVFMLVVGPLIVFVYGEEFRPAVDIALWLAPASSIKGILQGLDNYMKGRGRPIGPMIGRFVAAVVMVPTAVILFSSLNVYAIAIASLLGQIICLFWMSALMIVEVGRDSPTPTATDLADETSVAKFR
jgi:O-antigen/teichoic acid export membrane protein